MTDTKAVNRTVRIVAVTIGAAVGLSALSWFVLYGSFGGLGTQAVSAALVYVVPMIALQAAVGPPLKRWVDRARFPMDWIIFVGVNLAVSAAAAGVGTLLTVLLGIVHSWRDLILPNRIVVVVTVLSASAARLYSDTRSRLEERNRKLEDKVAAGGRTLQLHHEDFERAREIQEALMPKQLPRIAGCELSAGCQPARSVGGDYFDAIRLGDASVGLAIGDVSGKGMAAALLMSNLQAIVRAFAPGGIAPHELCAKANQLIVGNVAPGKFITFFYAVVDTGRMRLDYCSAGHNPPILQRRDGTCELLSEGGPVLGVFPAAQYPGGTAELRSGDCLVLFTDGITEAMNASDEEFGDERLMQLLTPGSDSAGEVRRRIMAAVTQFTAGTFQDDATMLVMSVN